MFFDKGKAPVLKTPADKKKVEKTEAPVYDVKMVEKKPISAKTYKTESVQGDDKLVFYCPSIDEYIEFHGSEGFSFISHEADATDNIARKFRAAWQESDVALQCQRAKEAVKELETVLGDDRQITPDKVFEELVLCRRDKNKKWGKAIVYVNKKRLCDRLQSGKEIKRFKRDAYNEAVELAELYGAGDASGQKNDPIRSVRTTFWSKDAKSRSLWKFTARNKDGSTDLVAGSNYFSASAEAQLLRFAAGASIEADVTSLFKGKPRFSVGGSGNITLSLAEGTVEGKYHLPNKNGYNLLSLFGSSDKVKQTIIKHQRTCNVLFSITLKGYSFVGVSAQAMLGLPNVDFSQMKPTSGGKSVRRKDAFVGAGAGASATATAGGGLTVGFEWKGHDSAQFAPIGTVGYAVEASAGIAVSFEAKAGLEAGVFRVVIKAQMVSGLGGAGGIEIELSAEEGYKFIAYILNSIDYHFAIEISKDAFDACMRIAIAHMTDVKEVVADITDDGVALVKKAFEYGELVGRYVKKEMVSAITRGLKAVDIRDAVPEASGALLISIMETPAEEDFDAILAILRPAGEHEIKSILRVIGKEFYKGPIPVRGTTAYSNWQGEMLKEGVRRLMEFGGYFEIDYARKHVSYLKSLQIILRKHNIKHPYDNEI